jgi:hypothetical protein
LRFEEITKCLRRLSILAVFIWTPIIWMSLEEYDGFGPLRSFLPANQQFHETWAVDRNAHIVNIETEIGVGWSGGADRITLKLMLSRDLNSHSN